MHVTCPDENTFRTVQVFLNANKDKFCAFALSSEKSLKLVIKDISYDVTDDKILKNLSLSTSL